MGACVSSSDEETQEQNQANFCLVLIFLVRTKQDYKTKSSFNHHKFQGSDEKGPAGISGQAFPYRYVLAKERVSIKRVLKKSNKSSLLHFQIHSTFQTHIIYVREIICNSKTISVVVY